MRSTKSTRKATPAQPVADSICYCNGERAIGTLELICTGCNKWFHGSCLKDLTEFYGLPFMVCYVFHCQDCSPTKAETWVAKQANFVHMCVTVLANLTAELLQEENKDREGYSHMLNYEPVFFSLHDKIIPYVNTNWENLTSMPRRVKNTWHVTIQKTLIKECDLFKASEDEGSFALNEMLVDIGPQNEAVKSIGRKTPGERAAPSIASSSDKSAEPQPDDGPKTRGASKRRNADTSTNTNKKPKLTADFTSAKIEGLDSAIDFPFNKDGIRYFLVEQDPNAPEKHGEIEEDDSQARAIPAHLHRVVTSNTCTISPNDRAHQLRIGDDQQTVTGYEGYAVARATHAVAKGTWYYEVTFLRQPEESHIRIGWSRGEAALQACVGYNKFSYAWRSRKGTKFHEGHGKTYLKGGFKQGDVLGLLIHLPFNVTQPGPSQRYLPPALKDSHLIVFKHQHFFELHDDVPALKKINDRLPGSYIEFFLNGKSCGRAFEDLYDAFYYPAVSIFGNATVHVNFGPNVRYLPSGARPMSERPEETHHEQTLSDMLYLVDHNHI